MNVPTNFPAGLVHYWRMAQSTFNCFLYEKSDHLNLFAAGPALPSQCYLPKKVGPCRASFVRYYYNPSTDKCQIFEYGGCQANANNFETPIECKNLCGGEPSFSYEPRGEPSNSVTNYKPVEGMYTCGT